MCIDPELLRSHTLSGGRNLCRVRRHAADRRGVSLLVVMFALSLSLVLTYSFMRTRSTALQIRQNASRADLALQAAQTGAALALQRMNSPQWSGVQETLSRLIASDASGTTSYAVVFHPSTLGTLGTGAAIHPESALDVLIESKGRWESADQSGTRVERTVQVVTRLHPRLSGTAAAARKTSVVDDTVPNPGDYDAIQSFALFAGKSGKSLVLDPGDRIDGPIWLYDRFQLYDDPRWRNDVRNQVLADLGAAFAPNKLRTGYHHPHPLAGQLTCFRKPRKSMTQDLAMLGTAWTQAKDRLKWPHLRYSDWKQYRVYAGGFEYAAEPVRWKIEHTVLRPSDENPLGVFYRQGNLRIGDDVAIQGTRFVDGTVSLTGRSIFLGSFNWRGADGEPLAARSEHWPRLPAIVADSVFFDRQTNAIVEGAIVVKKSVKGAGGDFAWNVDAKNAFRASGQATSTPLQQPLSLVTVSKEPAIDLKQLQKHITMAQSSFHRSSTAAASQNVGYAIWLQDGSTGNWYPIVKVVPDQRQLIVVGEVEHTAPTEFRIEPHRKRYIDIRGPIAGQHHEIHRLPAWDLNEESWDNLLARWKQQTDSTASAASTSTSGATGSGGGTGKSAGKPGSGKKPSGSSKKGGTTGASGASGHGSGFPANTESFLDFLADPKTFSDWSEPYKVYGLTVEPTFHLRRLKDVYYRWAPPLFRPYVETRRHSDESGYRWEVVSWRELP